jgi:hypothetical protein
MNELAPEATLLNTTSVARQTRVRIIGVRVSPQEAKVVEDLADEQGLNLSDIMRLALRRAYPERFPRTKKRKRQQ